MSSAVIDQRILKFISFCHATFKNSKEVAFGVDQKKSTIHVTVSIVPIYDY